MRKITIDLAVSPDGRIMGELWLDADAPDTAALLQDIDAHPQKQAAAGFSDLCTYHGAPVGLTRWHHLQAAGVVSGVPAFHPPAIMPKGGESAKEYATRIQKVGV